MIKIDLLTEDELVFLCSQVPIAKARQYFQKYPKSFSDIKPGFRPQAVSESEVVSILVRNANTPFISSFLQNLFSTWISQIQDNQKKLMGDGYSEEISLLMTIPDSIFHGNPSLYFKFIDPKPSEEYIRLFCEALSLKEKEAEIKEKNETMDSKEVTLQRDGKGESDLSAQIPEFKQRELQLQKELTEAQEKINDQEVKINKLKGDLQEEKSLKDEMQSELDHYRNLESYSDEEPFQENSEDSQHVSVGQVYHDNKQRWISRIADIISGEIVPFYVDNNAPRVFNNRDRLFWKDGPEEDNSIGIWNWRAEPNLSDPMKDYVISEYNSHKKPIEIIELPQCKNLSEIVNVLTDWVEVKISFEKVLFICTNASGNMDGLLCSVRSMEIVENRARLLPSVFLLPHYTIRPSDTIRISGYLLYRRMSLGIPQSVIRVRTPYDVVKKLLLSRVTISSLREYELSKREAQKCKLFLEGIPTDTIIQEISDAYACTEKEARTYVEGFIDHADKYLSENDLDINIISSALERNPELINVCKRQLSDEWEKDYSDKLEEANKSLSEIKQSEADKRKEIEGLVQTKKELNEEIQQIQQGITNNKQLANDVERETTERINAAKQNVAEFVSKMAFITPFVNSNDEKSKVGRPDNSISIFKSTTNYTLAESVDDVDTFEEELIDNIRKIGYSEDVAVEMAQTISFCICSRIPVVIGANAVSLAQCLATTIGGQKLTEVFVTAQPTVINNLYELIKGNQSEFPTVYLIHGVFEGYSLSIFNEVCNLVQRSESNIVVLLSLQGISPKVIFENAWSSSFFIDGDLGFERLLKGPIRAVKPEMVFIREIEENEYKAKRKELLLFSSVLKNIQISWYARYLAIYNTNLNDSQTILSQIITVGRSSGSEDKLRSLFHDNGISNGEKMMEELL